MKTHKNKASKFVAKTGGFVLLAKNPSLRGAVFQTSKHGDRLCVDWGDGCRRWHHYTELMPDRLTLLKEE